MVVGIDFGDDHSVVFKKGKTKPTYVIDGGNPLNPGGSVPAELAGVGVYPLEVGGDKLWPQIATQFPDGRFSGAIFLLNKPGRVMAEVVADVERVGRLSKAMKLCEADRRAAVSKLKVRRKDKGKIEAELTEFLGLDTVVETMSTVEENLAEAAQVQVQERELAALEVRHHTRAEEVRELRGVEGVPVPEPETFEEVADVAADVKALSGLAARHTGARDVVGSLAGIELVEVPARACIIEGAQVGKNAAELRELSGRMVDAIETFAGLAGIGEVQVPGATVVEEARGMAIELGGLRQVGARHNKAAEEVLSRQAAHNAAESVQLDPAPWELVEKVVLGIQVLDDLGVRLQKARGAVEHAEGQVGQIEGDLDVVRGELVELVGEVESCPICRTPMSETHLHEEVA